MRITFFFLTLISTLSAANWQAGVATVNITPEGPIWMSGYAARKEPSKGVEAPLFAKALALSDGPKEKLVIITTDIIGFPRVLADEICVAALKKYGLERRQIVLNSSHTHSGPVIWPNLASMYSFDAPMQATVEAYSRRLVTQIVDLIGASLGKLAPARLEYTTGTATFASNRRLPKDGQIVNSPNPDGPIDHSVPVIQVITPNGQRSAILFGYGCHNTTLTAEFLTLSGDFAGFAQAEVERRHPGTVALYAQMCAGDQNPNPRSQLALAKQHGLSLAQSVDTALKSKATILQPRLRSGFQIIDLPFAPYERKDFEAELQSPNSYARTRAATYLKAIDERRAPRTLPYPIQVLRLGDLAIVTLGGEVVVDYCLRLKRESGEKLLFTLAYSNDVACYIPTKKIAEEGGYEGKDSFIYYGQPAPLSPRTEEVLMDSVLALLRRIK